MLSKIFQIFIALGVMLWLAVVSVRMAGDIYLKDMVGLYGSDLFGESAVIQGASVSWQQKQFLMDDFCVASSSAYLWANTPALCASSMFFQLPKEFSPDWRTGLAVDLVSIDALQINDVTVFLDIDSGGGNFQETKLQLSGRGSNAMKDRLNAKIHGVVPPELSVHLKSLKISEIKVVALSKESPEKNRNFSISDLDIADIGLPEETVTPTEIIERVFHVLADKVHAEAVKRGVIVIRRPIDDESQHKKLSQSGDEKSGSENKSSVGEAVRSIGNGFKKAGEDIWHGAKNAF